MLRFSTIHLCGTLVGDRCFVELDYLFEKPARHWKFSLEISKTQTRRNSGFSKTLFTLKMFGIVALVTSSIEWGVISGRNRNRNQHLIGRRFNGLTGLLQSLPGDVIGTGFETLIY